VTNSSHPAAWAIATVDSNMMTISAKHFMKFTPAGGVVRCRSCTTDVDGRSAVGYVGWDIHPNIENLVLPPGCWPSGQEAGSGLFTLCRLGMAVGGSDPDPVVYGFYPADALYDLSSPDLAFFIADRAVQPDFSHFSHGNGHRQRGPI
jgi:hypothetical protein